MMGLLEIFALCFAVMIFVMLIAVAVKLGHAPTGREFTAYARKVEKIEEQLPDIQAGITQAIRDSESRIFSKLDAINKEASQQIQTVTQQLQEERLKVAGMEKLISNLEE